MAGRRFCPGPRAGVFSLLVPRADVFSLLGQRGEQANALEGSTARARGVSGQPAEFEQLDVLERDQGVQSLDVHVLIAQLVGAVQAQSKQIAEQSKQNEVQSKQITVQSPPRFAAGHAGRRAVQADRRAVAAHRAAVSTVAACLRALASRFHRAILPQRARAHHYFQFGSGENQSHMLHSTEMPLK